MGSEPGPSFEELTQWLSPQLRTYLRRMVQNATDAEDLLQETLLRIARGLPGFEGRASVKNWAYRIASNVAIDFIRRSKRSTLIEFDESAAGEEESVHDEDDPLVLDEMNECVRQVIDGLPPRYRAALVLHHLQGKAAAEIAQILEITPANTKMRIHRAKARLREALDRECDFYTSDVGTLRCNRKQADGGAQ
jgi:RNA polymerase sigma-70 factor (ECF subfamily)